MESVVKIYTDRVREQLKYFGMWPIELNAKLGDYGTLDNNYFKKVGNITDDLGIDIQIDESGGTSKYCFKDGESVEVKTFGKANLHKSKAAIEISFSGGNGIYFAANNCSHFSIKNYIVVGQKIIHKFNSGYFKANYVVVTEVVKANSSTIVVSKGNNASITLEADAEGVSEQNLIDGSIGFSIHAENNIAFSVLAKKTLTPLIGLSNISSDFFLALQWGHFNNKKINPFVRKVAKRNRNSYANSSRITSPRVVASLALTNRSLVLDNKFISTEFILREMKRNKAKEKYKSTKVLLADGNHVIVNKSDIQVIKSAIRRVNHSQIMKVNDSTPNVKMVLFKQIK